MTPAERLKEIEDSHNNKKTYHDADHVSWLISRVRELEAALEKIVDNRNSMDFYDFIYPVAKKALRGES